MKVVINTCFGGFNLSKKAIKRLAELQGRDCYFFSSSFVDDEDKYTPCGDDENDLFFTAFDIDNPNDDLRQPKQWFEMSTEEKNAYNKLYEEHTFPDFRSDRTNPLLIQIIEELGEAANGRFAKLHIVEIPDGIEYEIEEYDGNEHIAEVHRTWS